MFHLNEINYNIDYDTSKKSGIGWYFSHSHHANFTEGERFIYIETFPVFWQSLQIAEVVQPGILNVLRDLT